jgi:opacity protein-like surface antigen
MKKILMTAAAVAALTSPALAQDKSGTTYTPQAPAQTQTRVYDTTPTYSSTTTTETGVSPLTGFYAGAYGGYSWSDLDSDVAGADADVDGWDYGLFAGYKMDQLLQGMMGINGALEAFYGWSNADDTVAGVDFEKNHEWGINFRPGISISETINPYGIIGYRHADFDTGADNEGFNGLDLGLGTGLVAMGNWGARLDYTHTFYKENDGVDPDEDDIRLGLAYHF